MPEVRAARNTVPGGIPPLPRARYQPSGAQANHERDPVISFHVLRVLGRGGMGTVYEALRSVVRDGAAQEGTGRRLALKVLHAEPDRRAIERFRDEARILALVRDRAVVWADVPVRLDVGWAVVMDLAPGIDAARILVETGPAPAPAAVEIVGEVARALHNLWNASGPDGPLRLLHRDLKPSNLQISRSGEVRILDFGNARAQFAAREAHTTRHIGGTPGFIAPERLVGLDGPEGDIWSLGMVLRELLSAPRTAPRITPRTLPVADEPGCDPGPQAPLPAQLPASVLALVHEMTQPAPEHRPTALQVTRRCRELLRELPDEGLPDWAERAVPLASRELPADPLVGTVLRSLD
jgi:serine/threonine protein kinase